MIYKIVFDTNVLRKGENKPIDSDIAILKGVREFCDENKITDVQLCIPEMVIIEWLMFKESQIKEIFNKAKQSLKKLNEVSHGEHKLEQINAKKIAKGMIDSVVKKNCVTILPIPIVDQTELINRALLKKSPFGNGESDPGFKDTIIFLSLKEDAMKYQKNKIAYVFITEDGGFTSDLSAEIEENSGQKLFLVKDISEIKDLLDEQLSLGLKRTKIRRDIENIISEHTELLKSYLSNKFNEEKNSRYLLASEKDIDGYCFDRFRIDDFREEKKDVYMVSCRVYADIRYKEEQKSDKNDLISSAASSCYAQPVFEISDPVPNGFWGIGWSQRYGQNLKKTFILTLEVNTVNKNMRIKSF